MHEIGGERGQSIVLSFSQAIVQGDVSPLDEAGIVQALPDHRDEGRVDGWRTGAEQSDHWQRRLLPARHKRPHDRRAAEQRDEAAPLNHSITSSARTRIVSGMVIPRAFAALRFTTISNLAGRSIGRSAGLGPPKIRAT